MPNYTEQGYDPSEHNWRKGETDGANGGYPNNYFFADTIRSLCIGFGTFFNDLFVVRYDTKGVPVKTIQVPLKYGPRMKSHDFRTEQESNKKYYIQKPNLTYRISGISFDSERASGLTEQRTFYSEYFTNNGIDYDMADQFWGDMQVIPYKFDVQMEANCEYISDANQILEQILVRFDPSAFFYIKEFWFANIKRNIKMILNNSSIEINQDYGEEEKREIKVSFEFTMYANLYKPIKESHIIDTIVQKLSVSRTDEPDSTTTYLGNFKIDNDLAPIDGMKLASLKERYDFKEENGQAIGVSYARNLNLDSIATYVEEELTQEEKDKGYTRKEVCHYEYNIDHNELVYYPIDKTYVDSIVIYYDKDNIPQKPEKITKRYIEGEGFIEKQDKLPELGTKQALIGKNPTIAPYMIKRESDK